jgi:hypothetical protein
MIRVFAMILLVLSIVCVSCVKHDVSFNANSEIGKDGSFKRSGRLEFRISGETAPDQDSTELIEFYEGNYVAPDENLFKTYRDYYDSVLTITWEGTIAPEDLPVSDYVHKTKGGPAAINMISIVQKNRWIFKDIIYNETFSDPVDTAKYIPEISSKLAGASETILGQNALKGIRDREEADTLLDLLETKAGLDLFRTLMVNPSEFDTLSAVYDDYISMVSDSLAGFAGVKQNPDSLDRLIHNAFDAAWDTLLSNYPGLFGSYLADMDYHNFRVEVVAPGCIISSNADTTVNGTMIWDFSRLDFLARDYSIEITSRNWRWINIALSFIVIAVILFVVLGPVRRRRAG